MAPIKFEEHIKEKLDKREIQPSAGSWDNLNSRLESSERRSGRNWWMPSVAAVVILFIATLFYIDQQRTVPGQVVERPEIEDIQRDETRMNISTEVASQEKEEPNAESNQAEVIKEPLIQQNVEVKPERGDLTESQKTIPENTKPVIAPSDSETPAEIAENSTGEYVQMLDEIIAKISEDKSLSGKVSEAEVDALLAEAANKISRERNLYADGKISADALLADVEFEVDQSFRKEVFEFLKEEFKKARTAVATRNQ